MAAEQRRRSRAPVRLEATLVVGDQEIPVQSCNISLKGMLCSVDRSLRPGQPCLVKLRLSPDVQVLIHGDILRSSSQELAIDFLKMDEQSFAHLKKIVEYNSSDADQVDAELTRPAFTAPPKGAA